MEDGIREVKNIEREFVMLLGYFVHKYCDDLAELDFKGFSEFMVRNPQLERSDDIEHQTSHYRVTFHETLLH